MNRRALFALAPLLVPLLTIACGGKTADGDSADGGDSGADLTTCKKGDSKKDDDGCNTCACESDGSWACTLLACFDAGSFDGGALDTASVDSGTIDTGIHDIGSDAKVDAPIDDPRCPSDWATARGAHDDLCPDKLTCVYDEGSCTCADWCGGPAPPPGWTPSWRCTPKPPPRTDGCPDLEPTVGGACEGSTSKTCEYGSCCLTQYACDGAWKKTGMMCPA